MNAFAGVESDSTVVQANGILQFASATDAAKSMQFIGHRGSSADRPENTIQSFRSAFEKGASGIEFDVHLSEDKKIIVLHDDTLDRTAAKTSSDVFPTLEDDKRKEWVTRLSYRDVLSKVDVGSYSDGVPEKLPLMEEVMDVVTLFSQPSKPRLAFCELKYDDDVDKMADAMAALVKGNGGSLRFQPENLIFTSFDIRILYKLRKKLPKFKYFFAACGPEDQGGPADCSMHCTAETALSIARYPEQMSVFFDKALDQFKANSWSQTEPAEYRQSSVSFAWEQALALVSTFDGSDKVVPEKPLDGVSLMASTSHVTQEIVKKAGGYNMKVATWVISQHAGDASDTIEVASQLEGNGVEYFITNLPNKISAELKKASSSKQESSSTPVWVWILLVCLVVVAFIAGWQLGRTGRFGLRGAFGSLVPSDTKGLELQRQETQTHPLPPAPNRIRV